MEKENAITIERVNVTLNRQEILRNISMTIAAEEIVAIIGPNGSGKTTLMKAMLDLLPYEGTIRVLGRPVSAVLEHIGYVPQRFDFDRTFPLTVEEFLTLFLKRRGEARIAEALAETGMTGVRRKLVGKLSGGELQRVLIARAILSRPKILFFDEPTSGIDVEGVEGFYTLLEHLNTTHHTTIVFVSHEISAVYRFADRIVCLNRDIICHGTPKDVLTREVLQQLYGKDVIVKAHLH